MRAGRRINKKTIPAQKNIRNKIAKAGEELERKEGRSSQSRSDAREREGDRDRDRER